MSLIFSAGIRRSTLAVCTGLRSSRHHKLNGLVARAFVVIGVPVSKEPVGLVRQDGKIPDSLTLLLKAAGI